MKSINQILELVKTKMKLCIIAGMIIILGIVLLLITIGKPKEKDAEVITVSTLEKIINVSELSTVTSVYNGVAEAKNEKKPEQIDYYVSYEAKVKAGIDIDKINIYVDNSAKVIKVKMPDVYVTNISVDIASLEFIFNKDKYNDLTVTEQAYKLCEADVMEESKNQKAILEIAEQNSINAVKALINPIVDQLDSEYILTVE